MNTIENDKMIQRANTIENDKMIKRANVTIRIATFVWQKSEFNVV